MRLIRIACAAFVCVALYPSLASAQDEAFKKGLQAKNDRNWAEMARQMKAAADSNPTESTRKVKPSGGITGVFREGVEYLPYYFLGEALKNQGDCSGAVNAWLNSEQQKVVQTKTDYRQTMLNGFQECAQKGVLLRAEFDTQFAASQKLYESAVAIAKRVDSLRDAHKDLWPPFATQYETAHRELENAYNKLTTTKNTRLTTDFSEVKTFSDKATSILRPLEESFNLAIEGAATFTTRVREVTDAIAGADQLDKSIDPIKTTLTDAMNVARKSGRDQLAQARDRLATGQKLQNVGPLNEAMRAAQGAIGAFNQVLDELKNLQRGERIRLTGIAVRAADEAFASISALMTTLEGRAAKTPEKAPPDMATQTDAIRKQIESQRQRYERARRAEDVNAIEAVTKQTIEVQTALNTIIQAFGPLTLRDRGVPAGLEEGARLFFAGDYEKAANALDPSTGADAAASPSLQLQAHLFRGASLFALYVRSGESRQELRTQTLAEIERCKQIDATFEPSTQVFAPRFITLYKTGGAAASHTAATP